MITEFFINLSERLNSENDLSDVTWALARTSPRFLKLFLAIFGFDIKAPGVISREVFLKNGGRPDFGIEIDEGCLIIEAKINDRNNHFDQYLQEKPAGFGFIANYPIYNAPQEVKARMWSDLIEHLNTDLNSFDEEEKKLITAYISYVKEVCSMVEIREMRLDNLESLCYFNLALDNLIKTAPPGYQVKPYNGARSYWDSCSGKYLELIREGRKTGIYPWIGIWYGSKEIAIYFSFSKDWCKSIYDKYKGRQGETEIFSFYDNSAEEDEICFEMRKFGEFKKSDVKKQKELLREFFDAVINEVGQYL